MNATEVRDLISNDLWQNTNIANLEVKDFKKLDAEVAKLTAAEDKQDFRDLCEAALEDANLRLSICVRYLATMTGRHPMDDRFALMVLEQYYEAKKWTEVEYIGKKILEFNESSYALRVLSDCYEATNRHEDTIAVWERLVKVDFEEIEILYKLADWYEKKGESQTELTYYTRICQRLMKNRDFNSLKTLWGKFVSKKSDNPQYLINLACRIASSMGTDKGVYFLYNIFDKVDCDLNTKIEILKRIISLAHSELDARDKLLVLFKEKYKDNPRLSYCLEDTGILQNYLDINVAINKFEREIQFVEGAFVCHSTWGIGRITKIDQDEMLVTFANKGNHRMSCNMAYSSLRVLPKTHIWVIKSAVPKEKIKARFQKDVNWGLNTLLSSFDNQASVKQMKAEMVPSIFTATEWTNWFSLAKKELFSNPYFGISDSEKDTYVLRNTPITFEEKELNLFRSEKEFYDKLRILRDFIAQKGDTDSDEFLSMINYYERLSSNNGPEGMWSFLLLNELKEKDGMNFIHFQGSFAERFEVIAGYQPEKNDWANVRKFFLTIEDSELKRNFIDGIVDTDKNWQEILVLLFPHYTTTYVSDLIRKGPKKNRLNKVLSSAIYSYKEEPDFLLYLVKSFNLKEWAKAGVTEESLILTQLQLFSYLSLCIDNQKDVTDNKRRQKTILSLLFESGVLMDYVKRSEAGTITKIYSLINSIKELESKKLEIKHFVLANFSNPDDIIGAKKATVDRKNQIPTGLLCTQASLDAKNQELDHIMNVEIPENSKEIGTARELGDLRENAEYQYGKDKQKNLNFMMNKLSDEVSRAVVVAPQSVDTKYVGFGTKLLATDNKTGKDVTYVIMGPWESDPDRNIINFQAPLGLKLYNREVGENAVFEINGVNYDFTIKSIELADF